MSRYRRIYSAELDRQISEMRASEHMDDNNDDVHNDDVHNGDVHNGDAHNGDAHNDDAHNGNGHSEQLDDVDYSGDDMDFVGPEQQDDCDRDPLSENPTPTQLDRENEVPIKKENQQEQQQVDQNDSDDLWTLPANKDICTLEEIRRGQVINKSAPNECPVPGCGKKINETRTDPTPGTIASGLRTHVLFVHYGLTPIRKAIKKKKSLGWSHSGLRTSPRKLATHASHMLAAGSRQQDSEVDYSNINSSDITNSLSSLIQKSSTPINLTRPEVDRRFKKSSHDSQSIQISSLQSLIQASGGQRTTPTTARPMRKQQEPNAAQRNQQMNPMTSSLFSILAGLTQQQQMNPPQQQKMNPPQQQPVPKNARASQSNNSLNNLAQQNRSSSNINNMNNNQNNNNRPANSSLLSLLNEKISGNVASSLQNQLRKTLTTDGRSKAPTSRQYSDSTSYIQQTGNNDTNFNGGATSILNGLISNNGDNRISLDSSIPINSFVETMASKTGSNIGPLGIAQVKKMLEKFTAALLYSSQTIADHYLEPFGGDVMQQKPEISASDVILAYKMMLKTNGQP